MGERYILAHDLGTTGNKASLYDSAGLVRASAFQGYPTEYAQVGWAEQNPEDWWQAVCVTTRELLARAKIAPKDVACVAFSGHMMGCVALDRQARPVRSAIIWADTRSTEEAQMLVDKIGMQEAYCITGHRASASYSAAKIVWMRNHQPELFDQVYKFVNAKDFIVARLTGEFLTDYSDASGTNLYDLAAWDWSQPILDAIELDRARLPELRPSTGVAGGVLAEAAMETGLSAGTPVVIGGGDGSCASVGAGVVREGAAYNYIGSSAWIALTVRQPVLDPQMRTMTWAHVIPDHLTAMGTMQAAGGSYQWLRDVFCMAEKDAAAELGISPYELMNLQAEKSPPGAKGLLFFPYLLGERSPRWNPKASGAFFGLKVQHERSDLIRAVLEGITLNLRVILEALEEQGASIDAVRVIGGGARGRVWRQILADIYGKTILPLELTEEATSLGAAIVGGIGIGLFKNFQVAEELVKIAGQVDPNPDLKMRYDELYRIFNNAYQAFEPLYDDLAAVVL